MAGVDDVLVEVSDGSGESLEEAALESPEEAALVDGSGEVAPVDASEGVPPVPESAEVPDT
jgi:hypothetical protein